MTPTAVYNVFHHAGSTQLACHFQKDGGPCWGAGHEAIRVYEQAVGATAVDYTAAGQPGLYLDQPSGKLYMFTTRSSDHTAGVLCMDTKAVDPALNPQFDPANTKGFNPDGRVAFCGFTPLSAPGEGMNSGGYNVLGAPAQVGSRWFTFNWFNGEPPTGTMNKLLCFDLSTFAACANQPYPLANIGTGVVSVNTPGPSAVAVGSKVIVPLSIGGSEVLACFDTTAADPTNTDQTSCGAGWPTSISQVARFFATGSYGAPYPMLSGSGVPTGVCLPTGSDPCWDLSGGLVSPALPNMTSAIHASQVWNGQAVVIGPRVYVPNRNDGIECYDYSTQANCVAKDADGKVVFTFPKYPGASPTTEWYTVNVDPQRPNCLWVNSDHREIANFDAFTGGACGQGPIRVVTSSIVGSAPQCFPSQFSSLRIDSPSRSAYSDGSVVFADASGNALPGATPIALDGNGTADLSSLQLSTGQALPQFLITLRQGDQVVRPDSVTVTVTWQGTFDPSCADKSGTSIVGSSTAGSTTDTPAPPAQSNVGVTMTAPIVTRIGQPADFTATVKNTGNDPAQGVELNSSVVGAATLGTVTPSQGTCSTVAGVRCLLGTLAAGATATVKYSLTPIAAGPVTIKSHVTGDHNTSGTDDDASAAAPALDPGAPPPAPPAPTQPGTLNAISTGTVKVNGVSIPSDTIFLLKSGDTVELNGFLTFTTIGGAVGTFSNLPFTASRQLSKLRAALRAAVDGPPTTFTVSAPSDVAGLTNLTLVGSNFSSCTTPRKVSANEPSSKVVQQLWGKAKGSFRTTAKYSSATIRGTTWGIQDRCDGSLTTAVDDPVDVADFVLNKTVTISGGQTYLAKPGAFTPPAAKVPTIAGHQTAKTVKAHGLRVGSTAYTTRAKLTAYLTKTGSSWAAFAAKYPALAKALAARRK